MGSNQHAILEKVESRIDRELTELHPAHRARFAAMRVPVRFVPIRTVEGEYLYIVAEHEGRAVFYSDLDEGWGIARPEPDGAIPDHQGELFRLDQIMNRLFGAPALRTCKSGH